MYAVSADVNNIRVTPTRLTSSFDVDVTAVSNAVTPRTKMIFLCSPNNPSGNLLSSQAIEILLQNFQGLVIVDEAYIDFTDSKSWTERLDEFPNLVVLQTFSKAWGLAGLRLGMCFANEVIIQLLNKIKPPYNINQATQELALKALQEVEQVNEMIRQIVRMRDEIIQQLKQLPVVEHIYPSDANFLLVQVKEPLKVYEYLLEDGIVVRDRSRVQLCEGCLRITIGTEEENRRLIERLKAINF